MTVLRLLLAPLLAGFFTLWAAWLALAADSEIELPRLLGPRRRETHGALSLERSLHVAHLVLLVLAGAGAAAAVAWWTYAPLAAIARLFAAVGLVWVVGDLLPRLVAVLAPEVARPARRAAVRTLAAFRPLFSMVAWVERAVQRALPALRPGAQERAEGRDMLGGVFALSETTVAEVMTPRIDIVAVDVSMTRDEVSATLRNSEHARLLVYEGHPDNVTGVIYAKDIFAASTAGSPRPWSDLIRPASFVPEGKTLDRQLRDFKRGPGHLAVVVDEFGGTAGIVTLEDILEQIVGEIRDEHDTDEVAPVLVLDESTWRLQGGVGLTELEGVLGHQFTRDDVSTVGGLVLAELGHVPRAGERLRLDDFEFTVDQVARRRVRRVTVRRLEPAQSPGGNGA
ncbi:MAG: hemolysin family protein [Gemmatimonadales bacterium]